MEYDNSDERIALRDHLNNIRPGKLGRSLKKPRNEEKRKVRRLSRHEAGRSEDVVQAILKFSRAKLTEKQRSDTAKILSDKFALDVSELTHPPALLKAIVENPNRSLVIKASKRYLSAIVYAYALYDHIRSSDEPTFRMFIGLISEHTKIPLTPRFNLLRAVLRLAIDYQENDLEADNHGKWSRDARAIEWLISQGVSPDGVIAYQKKYGGGVDKWSRLISKEAPKLQRQKVECEVAASQMERRLSHKVTNTPGLDAANYDSDDDSDGEPNRVFDWGKADLSSADRDQMRLQKLVGGGPWLNQMLLYYTHEKGIAAGEVMLTLVVGDANSPVGCRLVGTRSVGPARPDIEVLKRALKFLASCARTLLNPFVRFSWSEAFWQEDMRKARATASAGKPGNR